MTVDTACSGGQVAFDLGEDTTRYKGAMGLTGRILTAVKHLQTGSSETALVCASNTHVW